MDIYKKWSIALVILAGSMLVGLGAITVIVDPYFHYHKPLNNLEYPIYNERYQNDGIVRHFEYDAIITGTSMTENFKTSELDMLFHTNSIKVPFSGATYKEINQNLKRAIESNQNIKIIIRGLDYDRILQDKDTMRHDLGEYPEYLYDNKLYNDVEYIFNKAVLLDATYRVIEYTKEGNRTTSFDDYSNWMEDFDFGKDIILKNYVRAEKSNQKLQMMVEDYMKLYDSLEQNVVRLAEENPQIQFYLFFPPYSIFYWEDLNQRGNLEKQLAAERATIEFLLKYDNIKLFSFFDEFNIICDLDNYKDAGHYSEDINSQILLWMKSEEHLLTKENYQEYLDKTYSFYTNYDYDALFKD